MKNFAKIAAISVCVFGSANIVAAEDGSHNYLNRLADGRYDIGYNNWSKNVDWEQEEDGAVHLKPNAISEENNPILSDEPSVSHDERRASWYAVPITEEKTKVAQQPPMSKDEEIAAKIRKRFQEESKLSYKGKNVNVSVERGIVTLRGPVENKHEKANLEILAKEVKGVNMVVNKLEIVKYQK